MNYDSIVPDIGQQVKCLLINNGIAEGYVILWDFPNYVKLKSLIDDSVFIIHNPDKNIVLTKIINYTEAESIKDKSEEIVVKQPDPICPLEEEFQKTVDLPSDDDLRLKKLAELRILMAEQDRKIIKEKISNRTFYPYMPRKPVYETPNWAKIKTAYKPGKLPRK